MKKIFLTSFFFFALLSLIVAQNNSGPIIKFEKTVHDYGTIKKGSDGKSFFKFTNTGKEPLLLSRPRSSCGCAVPEWPQQPIMPGQSNVITVIYDTNKIGPINRNVTIISNADNSPVVLQILGNVVE